MFFPFVSFFYPYSIGCPSAKVATIVDRYCWKERKQQEDVRTSHRSYRTKTKAQPTRKLHDSTAVLKVLPEASEPAALLGSLAASAGTRGKDGTEMTGGRFGGTGPKPSTFTTYSQGPRALELRSGTTHTAWGTGIGTSIGTQAQPG
jgi:hypothetical protein